MGNIHTVGPNQALIVSGQYQVELIGKIFLQLYPSDYATDSLHYCQIVKTRLDLHHQQYYLLASQY